MSPSVVAAGWTYAVACLYTVLLCFRVELLVENSTKNQVHHISFCKCFTSKFIILTLFSSKKKFSHSVFCDWGTRTSVGDVSSSRINNCPASLEHGLGQVVNHLLWNGHPVLQEGLKLLTHICKGVQSVWNTSPQLVASVFVWVEVWGRGS